MTMTHREGSKRTVTSSSSLSSLLMKPATSCATTPNNGGGYSPRDDMKQQQQVSSILQQTLQCVWSWMAGSGVQRRQQVAETSSCSSDPSSSQEVLTMDHGEESPTLLELLDEDASGNPEDVELETKLASMLDLSLSPLLSKQPSFVQPPSQVPFTRQVTTWDCGIACLQMVLRWAGESPATPSRQELLREAGGTQSIWTMDLVNLLQQQRNRGTNLSYALCSKALEVAKSHESLHYYQKTFSQDEVRINGLFQQAQRDEWPLIHCNQQRIGTLMRMVALHTDCIAIALLDNNRLKRRRGRPYAGHYVIVTGIEQGNDGGWNMSVLNPSMGPESIPVELFEDSFRADGTDEDVVYISRKR